MNGNEYQKEAKKTAASMDGSLKDFATLGLGVVEEAGEVASHIKKYIGHGHDLDPQKVAKELGDVLWYVAVLSDMIGYDLEEIMQINLAKLKERYPNGFSTEASINRKEEE